jgi:hypothetical protein
MDHALRLTFHASRLTIPSSLPSLPSVKSVFLSSLISDSRFEATWITANPVDVLNRVRYMRTTDHGLICPASPKPNGCESWPGTLSLSEFFCPNFFVCLRQMQARRMPKTRKWAQKDDLLQKATKITKKDRKSGLINLE